MAVNALEAFILMGNDINLNSSPKRRYGIRDEALVDLASSYGVPFPASVDALTGPKISGKLHFIENKIYDFCRISEIMNLSISTNHHANSGPVCRLLEAIVAYITKIEPDRKVIAVNSGTSALHLACNFHGIARKNLEMRWVTSAFTFKSSTSSTLSNSIVIDSDPKGRFDLNRLKELSLESYDGVIFTNVFSQMADWADVATFCKENNKKLVIDNATGLLDRIKTPVNGEQPIEIISAHHTKPWGVGECGMILCTSDQELTIRNLTNFGKDTILRTRSASSNFKLSDLAAAAIIDRLERMPFWVPLYHKQERRMAKIIADELRNITSLQGTTKPKSPRSYAPFCNETPIHKFDNTEFLTVGKYYNPLGLGTEYNMDISNSLDLYSKILCIPNAPEYFTISSDEIANDIKKIQNNSTKIYRELHDLDR